MKTFKEFLKESSANKKYEVTVAVRDARKANDIASDIMRGEYDNDGSDVFVFKTEDDKEYFESEMKKAKIEILD